MPVERSVGGSSLIDVLDRVLDKGIVIDAWVRVSLVGIDLITVEARIVVASIDTYLKYSEAVGQVGSVSKPLAMEPARASDTVLAENAELRRQLAASEGGGKRLRRQLAASEAGGKPVAPAPPLAGEDRAPWPGPPLGAGGLRRAGRPLRGAPGRPRGRRAAGTRAHRGPAQVRRHGRGERSRRAPGREPARVESRAPGLGGQRARLAAGPAGAQP